jgi:class 3 adenylate cyclase
MRCASCGFENPEGAKFCEDCGTPFRRICPSCGQQIRPTAKFCGECGTTLGTAGTPPATKSRKRKGRTTARKSRSVAPEAERRQLTVMFCDLVGSTALSTQLDPEELRAVIQTYRETCATIIRRFEGYLAKYIGDGLLVYFGYPLAHEDDAQRAVRVGLGVVGAMRELPLQNTRLQHPLQVRIGIHTGLVVAGEMGVGDQPEPLAIVGETPNIAARLQEHAN